LRGVIGLKDLVEKGLFQGADLATPVSEVMRPEAVAMDRRRSISTP
jgi:CBS domain-containing protein